MKKILPLFILLSAISYTYSQTCAPIISGPNTVCIGTTVGYSAYSSPPSGLSWSINGGGSFSGNPFNPLNPVNPQITWSTQGTWQITVSSISCPGSPSTTYTVNVINASSISAPTQITGPISTCSGTTSIYSVPAIGGLTPVWLISNVNTFGTQPVLTPSGNQVSITWPGTGGSYILSASYTNGTCSGAQKSVTIGNSSGTAAVSLSGNGTDTFCKNQSFNFVAYGDPFDIFTWSLPSGGTLTPNGNTASVQWTDQGSFGITVTATNPCGTTRSASRTITVGPPVPSVPGAITKQNTITCKNQTERFSVTPVSGATSYKWLIRSPDGLLNYTTSSAYLDQTFSADGDVTASVVASNGFCDSPSTPDYLFKVGVPAMQASFPAAVCVNTPATFSVTSGGSMAGYSFTWDVGDGVIIGSPTGSSISVKWSTEGPRPVSAVVTTPCGNVSVPASFPPKITYVQSSFTLSPITGVSQACLGEYTYQMSAIPQGIIPGWSITLPGGGATTGGTVSSTTQSGASAKVAWNTPGNYTVTATATNACGASQSQSLNVNIANELKPTTPSINGIVYETLCTGSFPTTRSYSVPLTAGYSYAWELFEFGTHGNVLSSTTSNTASVTWNLAGTNNLYVTPSTASCTGEKTYMNSNVNLNSTVGTLSSSVSSPICIFNVPSTTLSLTSSTGSVTYQVRKKIDNGSWTAWSNFYTPTYALDYSGFAGYTFTVFYYEFQAVVQNGSCAPVTSNTVSLTSYLKPGITNTDSDSFGRSRDVCSGGTVSIVPTSTLSGTTFTWTATITGSITATTSGTGNISEVLTNTGTTIGTIVYNITPTANGCSGPAQNFTTYVYPKPVLAPNQVKTICSGTNVYYNILVSPEAELNWPDPDGSGPATGAANRNWAADINDDLVNASNAPLLVTYQVTPFLRINNGPTGCTGSTSNIVITVNPKPAMTSPSSAVVCSTDQLNHSLTSNIPATYSWYATNNPSTTGESTGGKSTPVIDDRITSWSVETVNYTVIPTSNNCAGPSQNVAVQVNPLPLATITPASINCSASSVTLTGNAGAGLTYQWIKDGVNIPSATAVNYTASLSGTYTLQVTSPAGCKSISTPASILLRPVAAITGASTTICNGGSGTLSGTITASGTWTLTLNNGASTVTGTGSGTWSKSVNPTTTTTYAITSLVDASCTSVAANLTGSQQVIVNSRPLASIGGSATTICSGASIPVSGNITASGAWTLTLSNGGGTVSGTGSGTWSKAVIPTATTTYTIASLVDANCSSLATDLTGSRTITVNTTPSVVVTPAAPAKCASGIVNLTASGATSYNWSPAIGITPTAGSNVGCYASSTTTYTVSGTTNGCTGTKQVTVTISPIPVVTTANKTICSGQSTNLVLTSTSEPATYSWIILSKSASISGVTAGPTVYTTNTINHTLTNAPAASTGSVVYRVTPTFNGCTGSYKDITVTINAVSISAFKDLCTFGYVDLTAPAGSNYVWSTSQTTQAIRVYDPGTFSVTYTNAAGCPESASILVERIGSPCIYARIASPNHEQSEAEKISDSKELTTHPNPANQTLTIELPSAVKKSTPIVLYDTFGKISYKSEFKSGEKTKTISTIELANGLYMLEIPTPNGGNMIRKVIISH